MCTQPAKTHSKLKDNAHDVHLAKRDAREMRLDRDKVPEGIRRKMLALLNVPHEHFESLKVWSLLF